MTRQRRKTVVVVPETVVPATYETLAKRLSVQTSSIAGQGLFATEDIKQGETVIVMQQPYVANRAEVKVWEDAGKPSDAFVYGRIRSSRLQPVGDRMFQWPDAIPLWYRMNHRKKEPNVWMHFVREQPWVEWVALKDIPRGTELCFNYGGAPAEWNR
jgi:hypothetical protein